MSDEGKLCANCHEEAAEPGNRWCAGCAWEIESVPPGFFLRDTLDGPELVPVAGRKAEGGDEPTNVVDLREHRWVEIGSEDWQHEVMLAINETIDRVIAAERRITSLEEGQSGQRPPGTPTGER